MSVNAFHEKAGRSQVEVFFFLFVKVCLRLSRRCLHASICTLEERFLGSVLFCRPSSALGQLQAPAPEVTVHPKGPRICCAPCTSSVRRNGSPSWLMCNCIPSGYANEELNVRLMQVNRRSHSPYPQVDHFHKHGEAHRKVDIALRDVHAEPVANQRDANQQ